MNKFFKRENGIFRIAMQASFALLVLLTASHSKATVATAVGTGNNHSCAGLATGGAKCWGSNGSGQLGNTVTGSSTTPVEVQGLSKYQITAIGGGSDFTCALTSGGEVFCWGGNTYSQLGTRAVAKSNIPLKIQIPTGAAAALSVSLYHACVLDTYGNIYCWGSNAGGQLNRNVSITKSELPLYAAGMNDVVSLDGYGFSTCYRDRSGGAKCFGNNKFGQLGIGTVDSTDGATYGAPNYAIGLDANVISTSGGNNFGCAVKADSTVFCWGFSASGVFGIDELRTFPTPRAVQGIRNDARTVIGGHQHACVITLTGGAQCWGANGVGQLGNGRAVKIETPSDVIGINEKIISISIGYVHSCALLESGTVKCFGGNSLGQLGIGTTLYSPVPVSANL